MGVENNKTFCCKTKAVLYTLHLNLPILYQHKGGCINLQLTHFGMRGPQAVYTKSEYVNVSTNKNKSKTLNVRPRTKWHKK